MVCVLFVLFVICLGFGVWDCLLLPTDVVWFGNVCCACGLTYLSLVGFFVLD